jgi:hypothetical protein
MNEKFLSQARFRQNPGAGYLYGPRAIENVLIAQAGQKQSLKRDKNADKRRRGV